MSRARRGLVVGGGVAGMSAATMLARAGVEVRLVDLDPDWRAAGAGITLTAATLRAFKALGILERVVEEGHVHEGIRVCDVRGRPLEEVRSPPLGPGIPGAGGILRPVLHRILADGVKALGAEVRLGVSVQSLREDGSGIAAAFTDGAQDRYDFVVGADGIHSGLRKLLFPDVPEPRFTGQACWRVTAERPPGVDRRHFFLGGRGKCGLTPVSEREMYLFYLEHVPGNPWREPSQQHVLLRALLGEYGGVLAGVHDALGPQSRIVYRPLEAHVLRGWSRGRAILIGDAAHASTPQLASGAGMSAEDGIVLAEELSRADSVPSAFEAFMRRRFERCRMVVENSLEIGRLEMSGAPPAAQTAVVARSLAALAAPI
ncbi:MAG TPA: FAD-dependent monooxygenase [Burkholderiales bacterium]|nr:FAD-dependent monooxygenase [Burkholderiales bacterium]HUK04469.1 FAD-dependent monooxygenase [Burkholderiales bacterium]